MDDPFSPTPGGSIPRQRSRPNLSHPLPAPPSSRSLAAMERSPSPPRRTRSACTGAALRSHLQSLMEQKSTQLQTLGTMGQEILKQQQELEERIKTFEAEEEEEVGEETQSRLKDLDADMRSWEEQNEDMMRGLAAKVSSYRPPLSCIKLTIRTWISPLQYQPHHHPSLDGSVTPSTGHWTWSSLPKLVKTSSSK